jgi:hypothetical protein
MSIANKIRIWWIQRRITEAAKAEAEWTAHYVRDRMKLYEPDYELPPHDGSRAVITNDEDLLVNTNNTSTQ